MTKLPNQFPVEKLDVIERIQLEGFYKRYTADYYSDYSFGHFIMAAYAAVPAYLTPDLLYKMWQNFQEYHWNGQSTFIHHIAVSDVLLAPFCHEISYELFRMEENTRLSFLKWMNAHDPLWASLKPHSITEIANFIENYHDRPNDTVIREGEQYLREQLLEVKVYKNPSAVANDYLNRLTKAKEEKREKEILDIINALRKATEKEEYIDYPGTKVFKRLFKKNELELWKHAIQQNNNTFASLLKETDISAGESSPLLLRKESNTHTIHVSNTETKLVTQLDALLQSRNYAVIIACSEKDGLNCQLFQKTIENINTTEKWELQSFTQPLKKDDFLQMLKEKLKSLTAVDNLVVYISASESALTSSGQCELNFFGIPITDSEFNTVFSLIQSASLSIILECNHAATPFWLNPNTAGHVLFAATLAGETVEPSTAGSFTRVFCDVLSGHNGKISNRQLFIKILTQQNESYGPGKPRLLSNRETYYRQFGSGDIQRIRIQHDLRLCGYLDKPETPDWDDDVEAAFQKFVDESKMGTDMPGIAKMLYAKKQVNNREQKPVLLFIFSDPERTLFAISKEIQAIKTILKNSIVNDYNEIKIFQNKPLEEISDFLTSASVRNRVQLFYYSGFDAEEADGNIKVERWSDWLSYQENMELVVLNTDRSGHLAQHLVQIGVGMAVGIFTKLTDEEGAAFGIELMERLAKRERLSGAPMLKDVI